MKFILLLLIGTINMTILKAQTTEDSVKAVVNKMFESMKNADAEMLKSTFSETAVLQTIATSKEGIVSVKTEDPKDFIDFVGKEKKGVLDERINFETIKIDGPLAIAWTPYKFFYSGTFSHCGVNSFQLVRTNGVWKIQYIIDTRRKSDCE